VRDNVILKTRNLKKTFPGVLALNDISIDILRGEVHALIGENGAGKSTLVKIISGAYRKDSGELYFDGVKRDYASTIDSYKSGISIIYQETSLIPQLNVLQNVFLGMEYSKLGVIDNKRIIEEYKDICTKIGFSFPANQQIKTLGIAEQKMVEILKAMVRKSKFIIMDEPTDSLSEKEVNHLFDIIAELKKEGITVLYITHILDEIFKITDRITVLRDGKKIDTVRTDQVNKEILIKMMVGHDLSEHPPKTTAVLDRKEILKVENLNKGKEVHDLSFKAYSGEILGITGLVGAGKTELARLLFGVDKADSGKIYVNNRLLKIDSPIQAIKNGIYMIPEDRKECGLIQKHSVCNNISLTSIDQVMTMKTLSKAKEFALAKEMIDKLNIKVSSAYQTVSDLSGGNQQKVVIAKGLAAAPKIYILDEPTRGIDVNAKQEVHRIMKGLAKAGACIIFVSSEVNEIAAISDRVLILKNGSFIGEFIHGATQKEIMHALLKG
jgi:ribose transport system ATP-binding protein